MGKTVLVTLAPGFEEIEALTVVDILRRGNVDVILAGTVEGPIQGRSQIKVLADCHIKTVNPEKLDMIILPGGQPGTNNLKENSDVKNIIKVMRKNNKYTAAICAAPIVLSAIGLLRDKNVTSYPGFESQIESKNYLDERVVIDGDIITSRAPGTAMEFSLTLLELLEGKEVMEKIKNAVLANF